jgi:hypothetical protein
MVLLISSVVVVSCYSQTDCSYSMLVILISNILDGNSHIMCCRFEMAIFDATVLIVQW